MTPLDVSELIADMRRMMPRMDGREALRELRRLRPDVRVVICSGYDRERLDRLFPDPTGRLGFIQKPFQIAEFSEKLRAFLTAPNDSKIHS